MSTPDYTSTEAVTYDLQLLEQSMQKWESSPPVRAFYGSLYQDILDRLAPGDTLELGSGIGVFKTFLPEATTSDIQKTRYVDMAVDCYRIAKASGRDNWGNLFALDVLHHLQRPFAFFESAAAALAPGGRLLLMEPAATLSGRQLYGIFHHEPIVPRRLQPPFDFPADDGQGNFANMGMSVALFEHHRQTTCERLEGLGLKLREHRYRDVLAYFSTGGFSRRALLPVPLLKTLLRLEKELPQRVLKICGLRSLTVLEKETPGAQ